MTTEVKDEFESLLEQFYGLKIQVSDVVKGIVVGKDPNGFLVDVGTKSEAYLPNYEVVQYDTKDKKNKIKDFSPWINIGDVKEFYVIRGEDEEEKLTLSLKRITWAKTWQKLVDAKYENETITVKILKAVKGGLSIEFAGIKGFIPASQMRCSGPFDDLVGTDLDIKVLEADAKNMKLIGSQRMLIAETHEQELDSLIASINVNDIIKGKVIRLTDFGAFIDIKGVDCLLPVSEISWEKIDKPSSVLRKGQEIEVKVIKIDAENKKISLSIKRLKNGPWETVENDFKEGQMIRGKIVNVVGFGVFVSLKPEIEALLSVQEMKESNTNPFKIYKIGDEIEAKIKKINASEHRIALSLKE